MSNLELVICVVGGFTLAIAGSVFLGLYLYCKSPEDKARIGKKMDKLIDKAFESRDDPNEIRWVP